MSRSKTHLTWFHSGATATNLSIKNAPDDLVRRPKLRAERNHRSLHGELMAIIEAAAYAAPPKSPREIFDEVCKPGLHASDAPAEIARAGWPSLVLEWRGVPEMPAFESYRGEVFPPSEDAFS